MNADTFHSVLVEAGAVICCLYVGTATAAQPYRITDLGTLGGTTSTPKDINASGQVTGESQTSSGATRAFLWEGTWMRNLGTLGGNRSVGIAINDSGQVTGSSNLAGNVTSHAFLWDGSKIKDLGSLGRSDSGGVGINAKAHVVGTACNFDELLEPHSCAAFMWDGTAMQELGLGFPAETIAHDINVKGQVTLGRLVGESGERGYLWNEGVAQNIGSLGGSQSDTAAWRINAVGHIAGTSQVLDADGVPAEEHAFLWNGSAMRDLGVLGGTASFATALNAADQVTGEIFFSDASRHAFLWDGERMRDINPPGAWSSTGRAINAGGQATGKLLIDQQDQGSAFLWDGSKTWDLNDLIDLQDPLSPYVTLLDGVDINKRGQIVAAGRDIRTNANHAYIATPMEYQLLLIKPLANSNWHVGATIVARAALVDANGKRIVDSRAISLANGCKVKFAVSGAQTLASACMVYNATNDEFRFSWKVGTSGTGPATLKYSASYKFSMPQTITTAKTRTISIIP